MNKTYTPHEPDMHTLLVVIMDLFELSIILQEKLEVLVRDVDVRVSSIALVDLLGCPPSAEGMLVDLWNPTSPGLPRTTADWVIPPESSIRFTVCSGALHTAQRCSQPGSSDSG